MLSVPDILARELPDTLDHMPTMDELARIRARVVLALPKDASVEITTFMTTVSLVVYLGKTYTRTSVVKSA